MTKEEAINCLTGIREDLIYFGKCYVVGEITRESSIKALEMAIAALANAEVKVEVIQIHKIAQPNDVSSIDFPGTSREDK